MENNNINLNKEIINQIEINSSVEKNDNLNLQQKLEQQENEQKEQKKEEQQKSKYENVANKVALDKAHEKILENKNIKKNDNLNLQQNVTNQNEITSTSNAEYLNKELKNLRRIMLTVKIYKYNKLEKKINKLEEELKEFNILNNKNATFTTSKIENIINLQYKINEKFNYAAKIIEKQKNINNKSTTDAKEAMEKSRNLINEIKDEITKLCDELEQSIKELENNSTENSLKNKENKIVLNSNSDLAYLNEELKNLETICSTLKIDKYNKLKERINALEKKLEEFDTSKHKNIDFFIAKIVNIINLQYKIDECFNVTANIIQKQKNINDKCTMAGFINEKIILEAKDAMKNSKKLINEVKDEITKSSDVLKRFIEELENNLTENSLENKDVEKIETDLNSLKKLGEHFLKETAYFNEELINLIAIVNTVKSKIYDNLEKRSKKLEEQIKKLNIFNEKNHELIAKFACVKDVKNKIEEIYENGLNLINSQKDINKAHAFRIMNNIRYINKPLVYLKNMFKEKQLMTKARKTLEETKEKINKEKDALTDLCGILKKFIEELEKKLNK